MTALRGWLGVGMAAWAAACASPQPQPQPGDTVAVAPPPAQAQRAETLQAATTADSLRRPPPEPVDRRPWMVYGDSLRIRVDTAGATAQPQPARPAQDGGWTAGVTDVSRSGIPPVTLRAVRTARNDGWDRVVFEFEGSRVPGYHVEYVDRPVTKCGSGEATPVAGQGWLEVRIQPAQAHTDAGQPTIASRERKLTLPVLKELEQTCDFEADVTWVLGVASPNRYRVQELSNPARLVVDVRH